MYPGCRLGSAEDLSWCHVLQSGCLGQQLAVFVHPTQVIKEDFCFLFRVQMRLMQLTAYGLSDLPHWNDKHGSKRL